MDKDKNMTLQDLVKLPRISRDCKDGQPSLLGLWIKANDGGDTKMIDLTMSAIVKQNQLSGLNSKSPGQFPKPMIAGTPGHSRILLRRLDLKEKDNG